MRVSVLLPATLSAFVACGPEDASVAAVNAVAAAPVVVPGSSDVSMAIYLTLVNRGAADTLLSVETSTTGRVVVHEEMEHHGMMAMPTQVLVISPGTLQFRPGGGHLMLEGLTTVPVAGDSLELTLVLARSGRLPVPVQVVNYADLEAALGGPDDR